MKPASLFGLIVLLAPNLATKTCTSIFHKGKFLPDNEIRNLTTHGILSCFRDCMVTDACMSFNLNMETQECQLNGKTKNLTLTDLIRRGHFLFSDISHCKVTGCLGRPDSLENGYLNETHISDESPRETVLSYICDPGYMSHGELVCQDDGTWSSPMCVSASSCSMVKQYQPDSEDGEYWLRLTNFDNYTTKIYCHLMSTPSPQEFLTLPNINYGIYPMIQDLNCDGNTEPLTGNCHGLDGEIWFNKIRVNITSMKVVIEDRTFANISNSGRYLFYGSAWDCYTEHPNNKLRCGTKGRFNIDLRGTGWRVSEYQQWETIGWLPIIESINRQMNETVTNLRCGGYGGGCQPVGGLQLRPFPGEISNLP